MTTDNWNHALLSEICEINPGRKELQSLKEDTEVSFLPMAAVSEDGKIIAPEKRRLKEVIKGFTYFRDGDVLVAKITPCFENGKRAIAKNLINGIGFGSTEFHVLRPKERVSPDWIFYAISKNDFRNIAKSQMTGTAGQKRVPRRVLDEYKIPVPDKNEQNAITEIIETQFTRLDATIKSLKTMKYKLEIYRKSVLKVAFEGKLVSAKSKWRQEKLSIVCEINPSKKEIKDLARDTEVSFVPMAYVSGNGKIISKDKRTIKEVISGFTYFKDGDVLLAKITPCFENGKKAIAVDLTNGIGFGTTEFHVLRPKKDVTAEWIFYNLSREDFKAIAIRSMAGAVGQQRVPKTTLENFEIPLPDKSEQIEVIQEIESRFSVIDKVSVVIDNSLKKAEHLRKSILKAAFEGKLIN
ncbi:MAG: restriction endonuclease subunit S [Phycisphaerae bacterium]|jgi:type I restriction enzyme S subunit